MQPADLLKPPPPAPFARGSRRYYRAPDPVRFPVEEKVPESKEHLELRTALYDILKLAFGGEHAVGCDQFVYWDPTNPRRCLAPDAFVRLGGQNDRFRTWKVWERGAPHVAVEILSATERDVDLDAQLERYRQMGVDELLRFDCEDRERPLRIWDRVEGDLVERVLERSTSAESGPLGIFWVVLEDPELGWALRPARDPEGRELLPTRAEQERQRAEQERQRAEQERQRAEQERQRAEEAERRLRELEAAPRRGEG